MLIMATFPKSIFSNIGFTIQFPCTRFGFNHKPLRAQTRPKKIAEGGICTCERADDVPCSVIHSCSRKALLKCKTDPI